MAGPFSVALPYALAGSWSGGRKVGTGTGTHNDAGVGRQWLNVLHHNAGPACRFKIEISL